MLVLCPRQFSPYFVLYIDVYVIDKTSHEHEPNQTMGYAVNPGLIRSKTPAIKAVLTQWHVLPWPADKQEGCCPTPAMFFSGHFITKSMLPHILVDGTVWQMDDSF